MNGLESFLKTALHTHAKPGKLTVAGVALIAMNAVEMYSKESAHLSGEAKKNLALKIAPLVVAEAINEGYLTSDQGAAMETAVNLLDEVLPGIIDTYAYIAKHPVFIQLKDKVKKRCGCLQAAGEQ